ncbi:MAG: efflux RND transporter periplasmic adaptor subunit [Acidobacteriota bacterium]
MFLAGLLGLQACTDAPPPQAVGPAATERSAVTALGRLEPGLGVIDVAAPPGERVRRLEVRDGDPVRRGDILAILESADERETEVEVQRARRDQADYRWRREREVGPLAIAAREATVRRLAADLDLATSDLGRTRDLVDEAVAPERDLEFQQAVVTQARAALDEARTRLEQERQERQLALLETRAALATAEAAVERAKAVLEQSRIRAPADGEVLDILVLAGESTDGGPILRLGEVQAMVAVAEVYETDARFVRPGQPATVESPALPQGLEGQVVRISHLVHKNDVLGIDPSADTDSRVLEARIRLNQPQLAAAFVHLQVDVSIDVSIDAGAENATGGSGEAAF